MTPHRRLSLQFHVPSPARILPQTCLWLVTALLAVSWAPASPRASAQSLDDFSQCQTTALISPDSIHQTSLTENLLKYRQAWSISTGATIPVAIIDTGVAQHPRLGDVRDGGDVVGTEGGHFDCNAHGTFVAGIIGGRPGPDMFAGIAPDVELISIRQTTNEGGDLFGLATAIDLAIGNGARVVNISLTACAPPTVDPPGAPEVTAAVARAEQEGVVIVAASGNQGSYCEQGQVAWPALLPEVLATAAVEYSDQGEPLPANYSITGDWVDIAAPGGPVLGPNPRQLDSTQPEFLANAHTSTNGHAQPITGTSFAAPVVAGAAALVLSADPSLSPRQVREILTVSARPVSRIHGIGVGVVDPVSAVSWVINQTDSRAGLDRFSAQQATIVPDTSPNSRALALALVLATLVPFWFLIVIGSGRRVTHTFH